MAVVYFDQYLGATYIATLVETSFFCVFLTFLEDFDAKMNKNGAKLSAFGAYSQMPVDTKMPVKHLRKLVLHPKK